MILMITEKCDEECGHCLHSCSSVGKHMDMDTFHNAVKFIKRFENIIVLISGGEPTLHPNFKEICTEIRKCNNIAVAIVASNGTFDDEMHKWFYSNLDDQFLLQITSDKRWYKSHEDVKARDWSNPHMTYVESVTDVQALGRAIDFYKSSYGPQCMNTFLLSHQLKTYEESLNYFFRMNKHCKPLVTINGDLKAGESIECLKIGTILDSNVQIFENLKKMSPCNRCQQFTTMYRDIFSRVK